MRKCAKCGAEISEDCLRCPECLEVQQLFEYNPVEQAELIKQDMVNEKKRKKTRTITVVSIVIASLVVIFSLLYFVFKLPQKYFGDFFAKPSVMVVENSLGDGMVFNFDINEFKTHNARAIKLLSVVKHQYDFSSSKISVYNENFNINLYDIDAVSYAFVRNYPYYTENWDKIDDGIDWGIDVFEQKETEKVAGFQWYIKIDEKEKSYRENVMKNNIRVTLSMLNPELGIIKINKLADKLLDSEEYSESRIKALHHNNVCYLLSKNLDTGMYYLSVYPMTYEDYADLIR